MKKDNKSDAANLHQKAETLLKKKKTRPTSQLSEDALLELIEELEVHQIKLELENKELKLAKERAKEEQLESSEEHFRSLSENARVGLYRTTPDGTILLANRALIAMLGYSSFDELAQRNLEQEGFESPHQRKAFLETIEQNGEVKNFESTWMRQDRTPFYVQESALAIRDTNGKTLFYDGTVEDITERKCAEDKLRINVKRLQELNALQSRLQSPSSIEEKLKLITDAVVRIFDADFARIWMIKPGDRCEDGCIHAQATEEEHICRFRDRCLHLMSSSGRYTHTNGQVHARVPFSCYKIGKIAAADEPKFLTNEVTTDPRVHNNAWAKELGLVSFAGYRLGDNTTKPLGVLALFNKQAISSEEDSFLELIAHSTSWVLHSEWEEAVLRESEKRYHNLVESIPDWIWEVDTQGNYTYASSAVRNILGYAPEELIGQSPFDLMPDDERQRIGGIFAEIIAKRQPIMGLENVNRHRDGRLIVLETSGNPIFGHNGEFHGYRGIDRDITVRKQMEEDLRENERLLLESQEIARLGSFSWNISKGLWTSSNILDRIFGIDKSYIRSFEGWLTIIHPDFCEIMQNYVTDEVFGKQQMFDKEYQIINQENGQERWVHGLGQLEFDSIHQPIKLIGTIQDITERKLSEETINNNKSQLSLAMKIAHLGAWEYDVANDIFTFNDSFYAIFRTNADQVGGNTMSSADYANRFVYPEDLSMVGNEIRMSIETDNPDYCNQLEHRIIYADGKIGYMAVRIAIVKDENGKTVKIFGINQDITERKQSENEILNNSKRLKALVEILQYPSHSIQDYLDFALNQAIEMTESKIGYIYFYNEEKKEFVLNSWSSEVMNECKIVEKQTVYQLEKTGIWGEAVRQRKPIVENDFHAPNPLKKGYPEGHAPLYKYLTIPVFSNDEIIAVVAVANKETDYTDADTIQLTVLMDIVWKALEKKKSDDALRESEEKLNILFASMTEMVTTHKLVFNENGDAVNYQITDCNDAFTAITGIKKEDAIGKLATEVYQTDIPPHMEEFTRVATTGQPYEFTEHYKDIDKYLMVSVISPTKDQFSTIVTDITVIQQIQDEIKAKNKELENYLYVASHDLRSPLVNIQGFSQRFIKQSDAIKNILEKCQIETETKQSLVKITNEDIPKTLNFILTNVTKMENLISGLLQISRTGRVVMTIRKVDMNRLIKTIIASHNFQITELSAKVIIEDLADCYGDENLLNQLFSNIISNALKYRDSSRQLVIGITCQTQFNKVIYNIKDSGIGIEPRHLEKIWDVFYRVDPGSDVAGEGIGLSLSRRITDKHKGKIWVESEAGKGSVFHIELLRNEFSE